MKKTKWKLRNSMAGPVLAGKRLTAKEAKKRGLPTTSKATGLDKLFPL